MKTESYAEEQLEYHKKKEEKNCETGELHKEGSSYATGDTKSYETDDQMVSHPSHYQSRSGLEVIDAIRAFTEDLVGPEAYNTGNIIKYVCRWKKKNGIQDLEKAMWYLTDLINYLKEKENK